MGSGREEVRGCLWGFNEKYIRDSTSPDPCGGDWIFKTFEGVMMSSDLLDEYCMQQYGHTDWEMSWDEDGNLIVKFYENQREEV